MLKLRYSNLEFQNFPEEDPPDPLFKGRGGEGGEREGKEKDREGTGEGRNGERGRGGEGRGARHGLRPPPP